LKLAIRTSQYFGATESNGPGIGVGARLSTRSAWRPNCYLASASCGVQSLRYVGRRWVGFRSACEPVRASLVRFFKPAAARRSIMPSRWSMPPQPDQLRRWHDRQHNGEGSSDTVLAPCAAATTVHRRNVIRQRPRIGRLVMRTNRWINRITTLWCLDFICRCKWSVYSRPTLATECRQADFVRLDMTQRATLALT
jgi:hypothetical protein